MTFVRQFTIQCFICNFVHECVCTLPPQDSIHYVANAILRILLVAVLNRSKASGLQTLIGPVRFVLLVVAKSALFYQTILTVCVCIYI